MLNLGLNPFHWRKLAVEFAEKYASASVRLEHLQGENAHYQQENDRLRAVVKQMKAMIAEKEET